MDSLLLRKQRIQAEIKNLQQRLINNGYYVKPGTAEWSNIVPFDPKTIPNEHKEWIARIWYLGMAMHRPHIEL